MPGMWGAAQAKARRLLRVLLLWEREVSANSAQRHFMLRIQVITYDKLPTRRFAPARLARVNAGSITGSEPLKIRATQRPHGGLVLVVISKLCEIEGLLLNLVYDSMFLADSPGPVSG